MNKLDRETRAKILTLLCEGMSIRAITRVTGAGKNTVSRLLVDAGIACAAYHRLNAPFTTLRAPPRGARNGE